MTEVQQKQLELLVELDDLCRSNGIRYFLYGNLAAIARRDGHFEDGLQTPSILIRSKDCYKFIECFEKAGRPDRYLESMLTNKNYCRMSMRYGDPNTLDFNTRDFGFYDHYGIFVEIEFLRPLEKKKRTRKINARLESGWEAMCDPDTSISARGMTFVTRILGRRLVSRWLFRRLIRAGDSKAAKFFVKPHNKGRKAYTAGWFTLTRRMSFEGRRFSLPGSERKYLNKTAGKGWEKKDFLPAAPTERFADANIPYAEYLAELDREGLDRKSVWKLRYRFLKYRHKVLTEHKIIRTSWDAMFLAGDRYNLWEYYQPKKLYLQELFRVQNIKAMRRVLRPYIRAAEKHNRRGLGLCFDKKVFEYFEYTMVNSGRAKFAQQVRKRVPKDHWKKLRLTDYRGNKIEQVKEESGLRRANEDVLPAILTYLRHEVGNCVYLYIDIAKYGLDNPNMEVWYDTDGAGINLVVMRYYDSISIYSRTTSWDPEPVVALIGERKPGMVSGQFKLIEKIYPLCEADYNLEKGYVFQLNDFRKFDSPVPIETAGVEDTLEIAKLICSNESIGGYYEIENLAAQLKERMETDMGRSLVIRKDGEIVAHIATYAEFKKIAVTAGLIAKDDGTNIPYGTLLESKLVLDLLDEGFDGYTFVTEKRRAAFLTAMGCTEFGRYGKMTLKE